LTLHVTDVFAVFVTVAVNCWLLETATEVLVGETATETPDVMVRLAWADLLASATLVALTVTVGDAG
jgi:NADH:ubiquinone oxidoreductase subunit 4 (subunit M)